jgi:hypothetical protein
MLKAGEQAQRMPIVISATLWEKELEIMPLI